MIIVDQVNLKLEKPNTPTLSRNLFPKKPSPNLSRTIGQNFQLPGRRRAQSASDRFSPPPQLDAPTASWKIDATCVHGGVAKPLCRELYQTLPRAPISGVCVCVEATLYGSVYDVRENSNSTDVNVLCLSEDDTPLVEQEKESEDAIQKKDDATVSNNEVPDHTGIPMEEIPYVGLRFDSLQQAQEFYSNYAKKVGFVTMIRNTNFDKTRKELKVPINQSIHCSCEGYWESRVKAAMRVKRITIAGCKARMYVMLDRHNDNWLVTKLELKYTHACSAEQAVHYSEYRKLTMHAKCVIQNNDEAGIQPNKTYLALANEVGGSSKLGYSEKDVRNYITRNLRCADVNEDVKEMIRYFMRMRDINPNFFYTVDVDETNKFKSAIWVDARCRASYEYFGDVVSFDTTYRRNKHGLPFASFVGVNHHDTSTLLAIITDQCKSIFGVIKNVFPNTRHR
ncbi:protein FAR1-RELATED SEQUENCE 5-like [Arachis ipaensis]|uniref:protein FAR1-RELATED SEQUENCE 5-like n=1 Tax=Arachis ipaensis TaxID=130454 RepID=UPI0007AFCC43|nr:protein FAR1-RELATED SEQUENCE 5-like [Arachis ipaensis]XP_025664758.1 protein FAR1-RELATED SEQUENCE 5-like [Arachis hypogaea]